MGVGFITNTDVEGIWKFCTHHFSWYGLPDNDNRNTVPKAYVDGNLSNMHQSIRLIQKCL